jgi:hypothetical protein
MRALLLVALAACGDNAPDSNAVPFANLDDASIDRFVIAGTGGDVTGAIRRITGINHGSTCPHVEISGSTVTLTGGCRTDAGDEYEGVARITNHWGSTDGQDARYELEQFTITNKIGVRVLFDGIVQGIEGEHARFDADVFVGQDGRLVKSELQKRCDGETCRTEGFVEIVGTGLARATGRMSQTTIDFEATLQGVDRVELDMERFGPSACPVWRVVGTDRMHVMGCAR